MQDSDPNRPRDESEPDAFPTPSGDLRQEVIDAISSCYDPEIPVNIWELGLIYDLDVRDEGRIGVQMTLTSPSCPVAESLPAEVERKIREVPGVRDVDFALVWEPPWSPERMSEAAKLTLGML